CQSWTRIERLRGAVEMRPFFAHAINENSRKGNTQVMNRSSLYRLAAVMMSLVLLSTMSGQAAGQGSGSSPRQETNEGRTYFVAGVTTKEQRTQIAHTGAAIETIGANYLEV